VIPGVHFQFPQCVVLGRNRESLLRICKLISGYLLLVPKVRIMIAVELTETFKEMIQTAPHSVQVPCDYGEEIRMPRPHVTELKLRGRPRTPWKLQQHGGVIR